MGIIIINGLLCNPSGRTKFALFSRRHRVIPLVDHWHRCSGTGLQLSLDDGRMAKESGV